MIDELRQWEYDRGYEKGKTEVLDKIRTEIRKQNIADFIAVQTVLEIIDKYRKEQE